MCLPGFQLTTFSTPSKPNKSQRVWASSSLHTSAQVLLPSELSGLRSCTFWNVSALTRSLRATDVQKVFGRIQMPNPLLWQDFLPSELTEIHYLTSFCQRSDLPLQVRWWGVWTLNPHHNRQLFYPLSYRATRAALKWLKFWTSGQMTSKKSLEGSEFTTLSAHGVSSYPVSYRGYITLPQFVKVLTSVFPASRKL